MSKNIFCAYNMVGKILCGIAGGIVGFIAFGNFAAILAFLAGLAAGHILEKSVVNPKFKESRK